MTAREWTVYAAIAASAVLLALGSATATVALPTVGATIDDLVVQLVVSVTFPVTGAVIHRHSDNRAVAFVFLLSGCAAAVSLAAYVHGSRVGAPGSVLAAWASSWVWALAVVPALTAGIAYFPDGRLPSPRWRWIVWAAGAGIIAAFVGNGLAPGRLANHPIENPAGIGALRVITPFVSGAVPVLFLAALAGSVAASVVRWRRGDRTVRRQLAWLVYAGSVLTAAAVVGTVIGPSPVTAALSAVAVALVPVAIGIAIVRHGLFDVSAVIGRSLVFGLLAVGLLAVYAVVGALPVSNWLARATLSAAIIAAALTPSQGRVYERLERSIGRRLDRREDPGVRLAQRIEAAADHRAALSAIVETAAEAIDAEHVVIEFGDGERIVRGEVAHAERRLVLTHQRRVVGVIRVGRSPGRPAFGPAEEHSLELLARHAGPAVEAARLSRELERSHARLVVAREEERRRMHRELHDDLGPTLAGLALQLGVARGYVGSDPVRAGDLVAGVRDEVEHLVPRIRGLVEGLRPPALDELGLVHALREHAAVLSSRDNTAFVVVAPDEVPALTAASEVVAYRIATEAMTNVVRHARARCCTVELRVNGELELEIADDGRGIERGVEEGIGLPSMRERAAEIGGWCTVESGVAGGTRVRARLPMEMMP